MIIFVALVLAQYQPPPVMHYQPPPVLVNEAQEDAYDAACRKAVRLKQKLAVHVGVRRAEIGGLLNVRVDRLEGYPARCVVICRPDGKGWMEWERTVAPNATDREAILGVAIVPRVEECRT